MKSSCILCFLPLPNFGTSLWHIHCNKPWYSRYPMTKHLMIYNHQTISFRRIVKQKCPLLLLLNIIIVFDYCKYASNSIKIYYMSNKILCMCLCITVNLYKGLSKLLYYSWIQIFTFYLLLQIHQMSKNIDLSSICFQLLIPYYQENFTQYNTKLHNNGKQIYCVQYLYIKILGQ